MRTADVAAATSASSRCGWRRPARRTCRQLRWSKLWSMRHLMARRATAKTAARVRRRGWGRRRRRMRRWRRGGSDGGSGSGSSSAQPSRQWPRSRRSACELRHTVSTPRAIEQLPCSALVTHFGRVACSAHLGLLLGCGEEAGGGGGGGGATLLPPAASADATLAASLASYESLGRLLGYCAVHGLRVPIPMHAAAFYHLTSTPLLTVTTASVGVEVAEEEERLLNHALCLLGSYSPRLAFKLRCNVSKRNGGGEYPPEAAHKYARVKEEVRRSLVNSRSAALDAMRDGMARVLGAALLSALSPAQLCARGCWGGKHSCWAARMEDGATASGCASSSRSSSMRGTTSSCATRTRTGLRSGLTALIACSAAACCSSRLARRWAARCSGPPICCPRPIATRSSSPRRHRLCCPPHRPQTSSRSG